jgi:hypothetical protein
MLCSSCQKQPGCLPAKLAENDSTLANMLDDLKDCSLRSGRSRPSLWQKLSRLAQTLWSGVKHRFAWLG